jgi:hypothetical protein
MPDPAVRFTPWTRWADRAAIQNSHLPGVYLLGRFAAAPRQVDPQAAEVVYIGEVHDNSLLSRWQQFHRAAFEGKPGHAGGLAYGGLIADDGADLYVAAFVPEGLTRAMRALYIRYVERKLVWEYASRWGAPPLCNIK